MIEHFWRIKEELTFSLDNWETQEVTKHLECPAICCGVPKRHSKIFKCAQNGKAICDLIQSMSSFRYELDIFDKDITTQDCIHFLTIFGFEHNSEINIALFSNFGKNL